jgi:hypothetical protein
MFKRFFAEKGSTFVIGILLCVIIASFMYLRMEKAEKNLADYWLAISCPTPDNCREKIEATVLESRGVTIFVKGFQTKYSRMPSSRNTKYTITLSSIKGENEILISANPPSNGMPFDIPNVHIPTGRDSHFIEENFYKGKPVYVEIWHGQIIFLYLDTIIDVPDPIISVVPDENKQLAITSTSSPKTYEIALPTSVHPIFQEASTKENFKAVFFMCLVLAIFLVGFIEKDVRSMLKNTFKNTKTSLFKIRERGQYDRKD